MSDAPALAIQRLLTEAHQHQTADLLPQAEALYRQAVMQPGPHVADAANNLGAVLGLQGRLDEAIACFRNALERAPGYPEAHSNLGRALWEQGRTEEAVASFRIALDLKPDHADLCNHLANALAELGRFDEAFAGFRRLLALRPDDAVAHNDLGHALRLQGRLDEAIAGFRRAIALKPGYAQAHGNLAMALLARSDRVEGDRAAGDRAEGDMAEGWAEYEWRWNTPQGRRAARSFSQPQWYGEPGDGRTLLLHAEQGYGDTLQFCRYAEPAAALGWRVVLGVQRPLVRLLHGLAGVASVIGPGETLPPFDCHCPLLSLPLALRTVIDSIPCPAPYLHADAGQAAAWRQRLATVAGPEPRVGLVWSGNPRAHSPVLAAVDRRRSIAPALLAPLLATPGVRFFSLQKGGPPAPAGLPLIDVMDEMQDFADTAALVANLDLVVSVDTAVLHLAAAMGKPVWLLDRFDPCWRWFTDRRDSPWYPTLRIYRQPRPGDWATPVAAIAADLAPQPWPPTLGRQPGLPTGAAGSHDTNETRQRVMKN